MSQESSGGSPSKTKSYSPAKTVHKAFALLELIGRRQPVMPAEIGRSLKLTRGNVHRLLATLEDLGYIERVEGSGYRLSFKLFRLGNTVIEGSNLRQVAHPLISALSQKAGEDVCLTVLHELTVIIVERIKSPNLLTVDHDIAHTYPIHCCASGKIFLASFDDASLLRLLETLELEPRTGRTITDPQALYREVLKVRRRGYSLDIREYSDDIHTIAAPICDHTNRVIATISVTGPSLRFTEKKVEALVAPVLKAAEEISRGMGCSLAGAMDFDSIQKTVWNPRQTGSPR